jgi:hypothetical protein
MNSRAKSGEARRAGFQGPALKSARLQFAQHVPPESRLAAQPPNKRFGHGWTLRNCFRVAAFSGRRQAFWLFSERVGGKTFSLPPSVNYLLTHSGCPASSPGIPATSWAKRAGRGVSRHGPGGSPTDFGFGTREWAGRRELLGALGLGWIWHRCEASLIVVNYAACLLGAGWAA